MKLSDLSPNPRNPRKITDAQLDMLKKSLKAFGDLSGFVYNRRTRRLVGGHQRARCLPADSEILIHTVFTKPSRVGTVAKGTITLDDESYVYREVDWDEMTEQAANLAANQHGGSFDPSLLSDWLLELDTANFDLSLTGFDQTEIEDLLAPVDVMRTNEDDSNSNKRVKCPECGHEFNANKPETNAVHNKGE